MIIKKQHYIILLMSLFFMQSFVCALGKTQKTVASAVVSALIVGGAHYYYDFQKTQDIKPDVQGVHQVDVLLAKGSNLKKYTQQQCLKRAIAAGLFAGGCAGFATHMLLPPDIVKTEIITKPSQNNNLVQRVPFSRPLLDTRDGRAVYQIAVRSIAESDARIVHHRNYTEEQKMRIAAFCENLKVPYESNSLVVYQSTEKKSCMGNNVTSYQVCALDTLNCARKMIDEGLRPAILDMANEFSPGGGPDRGCTAQEEQICYRSNLFAPLYYARKLVPTKKSYHEKSFIAPSGAIYIPDVTVTKACEALKYRTLTADEQYNVDIIASAALDLRAPRGASDQEIKKHKEKMAEYMRTDDYKNCMKEKIRTQLRVARENGHDSLLLSAFGCGAFENDPWIVSQLYRDVFNESEFADAPFKNVVFSIFTARDGNTTNLAAFKYAFGIKD